VKAESEKNRPLVDKIDNYFYESNELFRAELESKSRQRVTKKQASPIVTKSSSRAMKISLMFNAATSFLRIS